LDTAGVTAGRAAFLANLNLGDYYFRRVTVLLDWSYPSGFTDSEKAAVMQRHTEEYRTRLAQNLPAAVELIVEQLRYQEWPAYKA